MTSASYSSQAKFTRSISKSGRRVSRCPRDRALRLQFKARILRDREQPARFEALLGSLTTIRPIVPQRHEFDLCGRSVSILSFATNATFAIDTDAWRFVVSGHPFDTCR